MNRLPRLLAIAALAFGALGLGGCTTTLVVMHVYEKITDGDPTSCFRLNTV